MKAKYLLRGIGIGIIIGVVIMFAAFKGLDDSGKSSDQATDTDAAVENETKQSSGNQSDTAEKITTEAAAEATTEKKTEDVTELTTEGTTEGTTELTTEEDSQTTEAAAEEEAGSDTVTITVKSGMSSTTVAKMLQEAGLIEDYKAYDLWLDQKGYSTRIRVGTYTLTKGMTDEEIAILITTKTE